MDGKTCIIIMVTVTLYYLIMGFLAHTLLMAFKRGSSKSREEFIESIVSGDVLFDTLHNCKVVVEKNDPSGFIVLDKKLGSEASIPRSTYIQLHGNDGRYSINYKNVFGRLVKQNK